jgi:hypothetical protein
VRALLGALLALVTVVATACSDDPATTDVFGAPTATVGESQQLNGWNVAVANLRFDGDYVLIDVDAAPTDPNGPHVKADSLRFGVYGALAHPIEANAVGGCVGVTNLNLRPAAAPTPDRLSGTVCLGPLRDQSQVRGVYAYSPLDRMKGTTFAYAAAYPLGLPQVEQNDTGLGLTTTSVEAFRDDGAQLNPTALGDPNAFQGNGYMLLGLDVNGLAERYRDESRARGGPLMIVIAPSVPGQGLSPACSAYGSSLLVLPEASLQAVSVRASLCSQGEINQALLFASVSVIGTHAALWTTST